MDRPLVETWWLAAHLRPSPRSPRELCLVPPQAWQLQVTQLAGICTSATLPWQHQRPLVPHHPFFLWHPSTTRQQKDKAHLWVTDDLPSGSKAAVVTVLRPQWTQPDQGHRGFTSLAYCRPCAQHRGAPSKVHSWRNECSSLCPDIVPLGSHSPHPLWRPTPALPFPVLTATAKAAHLRAPRRWCRTLSHPQGLCLGQPPDTQGARPRGSRMA